MAKNNRSATRRSRPTPEQIAKAAAWLGVDLSGTVLERARRAAAHIRASRVCAALANAETTKARG